VLLLATSIATSLARLTSTSLNTYPNYWLILCVTEMFWCEANTSVCMYI
jgi:hypothetical protein